MLDLKDKKLSIVYSSALEKTAALNSTFDRGILRIAYYGFSRNKTYISKEAFENAAPSMYNCPVVCNYIRETDSIGSHDVRIVDGKDGVPKLVNITTPVGVVPESAEYYWESVEEDNGTIHNYMCVPCLIWKRQEAYEHIRDNGITSESMEIVVKDGQLKDDGYVYINSFEFTAFCLLESAEPCFESACVEMFALDEFNQKYSLMMTDFKREFAKLCATEVVDINAFDSAEQHSKGGDASLDMNELMLKYGITESDINFDIDGMTLEDIEAKFAEIHQLKFDEDDGDSQEPEDPEGGGEGGENEPEGEDDPGEEGGDPESGDPEGGGSEGGGSEGGGSEGGGSEGGGSEGGGSEGGDPEGDDDDDVHLSRKSYSLTAGQIADELCDALRVIKYDDPDWGACTRYGYVDYDAELCEVYAYDYTDWKLYGFPYSFSGDVVTIDFECKKRKRFAFVDFDMGSEQFSYKAMFDAIDSKYSTILEEVNSLREYKLAVEQAEHSKKAEEVFAKFNDIADDPKLIELKENAQKYSIEELEEKCYAICGRFAAMKFSMGNGAGSVRIPVEHNELSDDEPYHGIFRAFGFGK